MTSVYARILLKYENTRIGEKIQCHASCGLDVRVTNTIQLQSKQEWLIFVHFSSAYNYHVLLKAAYVSKISCKLLRFLSFSCTRPRSKVWKNPENLIQSNLSFMATIFAVLYHKIIFIHKISKKTNAHYILFGYVKIDIQLK